MEKRFSIGRLLASIIVGVISQAAVIAGFIFPTTAVMMYAFISLIAYFPAKLIVKYSSEEMDNIFDMPWVKVFNSNFLNYLVLLFVPIWFGIYAGVDFYREGKFALKD